MGRGTRSRGFQARRVTQVRGRGVGAVRLPRGGGSGGGAGSGTPARLGMRPGGPEAPKTPCSRLAALFRDEPILATASLGETRLCPPSNPGRGSPPASYHLWHS